MRATLKRQLSELPSDNQKREMEKLIRQYKQMALLFVVLDVFVAALLGITVNYYQQERPGSVITLPSDKMCLPYDDVRLHPDEEHLCAEEPGENKTECCLKPGATLDDFVGHFASHWFKKRLNDENPTFTSCNKDNRILPIIKVVGKTEKQRNNTQQIDWDSESNLTYMKGLIEYDDGNIVIRESGLYTVYSQVVFQHGTTIAADNDQSRPLIFTHTVAVKPVGSTRNYENIILKSSSSECECQHVNRHNTTSYVGTSYQLTKGDRLSVKVRNVGDVIPSAHMNFFGVHMQ